MKRKLSFGLIMTCLWLCFSQMQLNAAVTTFPYYNGFETPSDTAGWKHLTIFSNITKWKVDSAAHNFGARSLYITKDDGKNVSYTGTTSGYVIYSYQTFTFPASATGDSYDIAFSWRCSGRFKSDATGATTASDAFAVALVPDATNLRPAVMGTSYPTAVASNMLTFDGTRTEFFGNTTWNQSNGKLNIPAVGGTYKLVFAWRMGGGNPGLLPACVDDIQIVKSADTPTDCNASPRNLVATLTPTDFELNWNGNATSYQLRYYATGDPSGTLQTVNSINTTTYSIPRTSLTAGVYTFQVRSTCATDTSLWVECKKPILVYDASAFCLDFLNFTAPGVTCGYGAWEDPFEHIGAQDFGSGSNDSRHTVHFENGEVDPLLKMSGFILATKPPGALASVRLGNEPSSHTSEGIRYRFHVTPEIGLLIMKYAVVAQSGTHTPARQPFFQLKIMDQNGVELDAQCTSPQFMPPAFAADIVPGDGWHLANSKDPIDGDGGDVFYREWTTIGVNLQPYMDQDIQIEIVTKDCKDYVHFGYAYFTFECEKGDLQGIACGAHPTRFEVDEGFEYKWYKQSDPTNIISTDKYLDIAPTDTAMYNVDMIFKGNANCKYTLKAWALPRFPKPDYDISITYVNCETHVHLTNTSRVVGVWDKDGIPGTGDTITTSEKCTLIEWTIDGKKTHTLDTTLIIPGEGDTIPIILRAMMEGDCEEIITGNLKFPSIKMKDKFDTINICQSMCPYDYNSKITGIDHTGAYSDVFTDINGCTRTTSVMAYVHDKFETSLDADTICYGDSLKIGHVYYKATGTYDINLVTRFGCDSVVHQPLVVLPELAVDLTRVPEVCADCGTFKIPFEVSNGKALGYSVLFDAGSKAAGFVDVDKDFPLTTVIDNDSVIITVPSDLKPNDYHMILSFKNGSCPSVQYPIDFRVLYPSYVIAQRWNDVLAVNNNSSSVADTKGAEHVIGGYEISKYEWFKNGVSTDVTTPQYYLNGEKLDFAATYQVELTRDDGVVLKTCGMQPRKYTDAELNIAGTIVLSGSTNTISSPLKGVARMYSPTGMLISMYDIHEGDNELEMPLEPGYYILHIELSNGMIENYHISVTD